MEKTKSTIEEMVKIFDAIWKNNPMDGATILIKTWPGICKDNGWTNEEFDNELYKWQRNNRKSA